MMFAIVNLVLCLLILGFIGYVLYFSSTWEKKLNEYVPPPPTVRTTQQPMVASPSTVNTSTDIGVRYEAKSATFAQILMSYKNMLIIAQRDACSSISAQQVADAQKQIIAFVRDKNINWSDMEKDMRAMINSQMTPAYMRSDMQKMVDLLKKTIVKNGVMDTDMLIQLLKNIFDAFCALKNQDFALASDAPLKSTLGFRYNTTNEDVKAILEIISRLLNSFVQDGCKKITPSPSNNEMTCAALKQSVNSEIDTLYATMKNVPNFNKTDFEAQRSRIISTIDSKICHSNPTVEKQQVKEAVNSMQNALCMS